MKSWYLGHYHTRGQGRYCHVIQHLFLFLLDVLWPQFAPLRAKSGWGTTGLFNGIRARQFGRPVGE